MNNLPNAQEVLGILAMLGIIGFGAAMIWFTVPAANHDYINFILGALAGALTVNTGARVAAAVQAITAKEE